jgi:uncharacterized protein
MADTPSPLRFHAGEIALQQRAGVRERLAEIEGRVIRDHMPDQHRELFEQLPTLLVGSLDATGQPWASMLAGPPGFLHTPDARHMEVSAWPHPDDPLQATLAMGAPLGLLGLEPHTRRRNRMNGRVVEVQTQAGRFTVAVDQSFGNCPQYIQARELRWVHEPASQPAERHPGPLGAAARVLLARTDTLFIASAAPGQGVDVSHRGGRPGFVRIDDRPDHTVLTVPDFRGNFFFNTLGNLAVNPRAGLLCFDPDTGDLLQLAGQAEIVWDGPEVAAFQGAQRLLRLRVHESLWRPGALPLRWSAPAYAPQLADTGTWSGPNVPPAKGSGPTSHVGPA